MSSKKLDRLISQLENYLECWKQFNHFVSIARSKSFGDEEELEFLELKSVITQELEMILASIESGAPDKEDVLALIASTPSLRFLSEMHDAALRGLESRWHKIYISWHSIVGQLKVRQLQFEDKSFMGSMFGRRRA
jgi:hypothetical protein